MSGEKMIEISTPNAIRPIIPTPLAVASPPRAGEASEPSDASTMLRHYFSQYQRLKKENSILGNQLTII